MLYPEDTCTYFSCASPLIVKVRGQISLYRGGSIIFGLSEYPISEFELVAEELLMSDSIIKASSYQSISFSFLFINVLSASNCLNP